MTIKKGTSTPASFVTQVREHLTSCVASGVIEGFVCTAMSRESFAATLYNGEPHSKGPTQENRPFQLQVAVALLGQKGVSFALETTSYSLFIRQLEFALAQSVTLRHLIKFKKQSGYPSLSLISKDLMQCFDSGSARESVHTILTDTERFAAEVDHPRLMNREVTVSLSRTRREYFDSVGNHAVEDSADCTVMVAYSLEDSSESHFDLFGHLPSTDDVKAIVAEASRNILSSKVKQLDTQQALPVLLTSKAVADLFEQIVLPNMETRTLLDKTGAWDFGSLELERLQGVTIEDNPHLDHSPFSAVFDFEGTPTEPVILMKNGVLEHPLMTSSLLAEVEDAYPQLKDRFRLTGHADAPGSTTHSSLFIQVERDALPDLSAMSYIQIQNLTGMSIDSITGQFALDADGAKVFIDGVLAYSTSLTLRGNFFEAVTHGETRAGRLARQYNCWAPSLLTSALSCVSKELAQNFEDN